MLYPMRRGAWICAVVILAGCDSGPDDMPEIAPVRGRVTLDGQPLVDAHVIFAPVEGGQTSEARTGPNGGYELRYRQDTMGAKLGKHKVYISTYIEPEQTDDLKDVGGFPEKVPKRYNENTTLEREVVDGKNVFDFELTSQ